MNNKRYSAAFVVALVMVTGLTTSAATIHVWTNSPVNGPGTAWSNACHSIQEAVDLAVSNDVVLVTNGVYNTGGAITPGYALTNRVCVTNAITIQSVNGRDVTIIEGASDNGTNGPAAIRGVYMANEPTLIGFTVTNGHTHASGEFANDRSGGGILAMYGKGMASNCILVGNSADGYAGGAWMCTLDDCVVSGNTAASLGGGAFSCMLTNCTLTANIAGGSGGGAYGGELNNCTLTGNSATSYGGGSSYGTLNNCTLTGNSATNGGGAYKGTLNNCTLTGNSAGDRGGGAYSGTLKNCIIYHNTAADYDNYRYSMLDYCCTMPMPGSGIGNITNQPALVDSAHISANSPCIGAGSNAYTSGTDIDGDAWNDPPSIGCDEFNAASATGALSVSIVAEFDRVAAGYPLSLKAVVTGHALSNVWNFADGALRTNSAYVAHTWSIPGTYDVVVTVYNMDYASGMSATQTIEVVDSGSLISYVWTNSPSPAPPYTNWATAALTIQDAVDSVSNGLTELWVILVTNGVYNVGGAVTPGYALSNRVCITKPLTIRSLNGPDVTIIEGASDNGTNGPAAVRGVYMENKSKLIGFTVTHGHTDSSGDWQYRRSGGGVFVKGGYGVISNCILSGNSSDLYGGGSHYGTLNNCTLVGNLAVSSGGGSYEGTLNNCTLSDNSATNNGGGSYYGTLNNCVVFGNSVSYGSNSNYYFADLGYSCTTPLPVGPGNIEANPQFVDPGAGDYHLRYDSPCIDTGTDLTGSMTNDLDGLPRPLDGDFDGMASFDMGAYEYNPDQDTDSDTMLDGWEYRYGLDPTNAADGTADADGDGMDNRGEHTADTNPTNPASLFAITAISNQIAPAIYFPSSSQREYSLQSRPSLLTGDWAFVDGQTNILGTGGIDFLIDSNAPPTTTYRLKVAFPGGLEP